MPISQNKSNITLKGTIGVAEADALLNALLQTPQRKVNLKDCEHLHPACLQVLVAANAEIASWPRASALENWIKPFMTAYSEEKQNG